MIHNIVSFPHTTIIPYQDFLHGHILFHLDNPGPAERETISNQKNPSIWLDWTPKSGSCTPLVLETATFETETWLKFRDETDTSKFVHFAEFKTKFHYHFW